MRMATMEMEMEILLKGINPDDDKFTQLNTKRFASIENQD